MMYLGPERYDVVNSILRFNRTLKLQTGAEVGVRHGETSEFLLHNNPLLVLLLVDPYASYLDIGYKFENSEQDMIQEAAAIRLKRFDSRAKWIYRSSIEASKLVEEGSLDFVFIDANHDEPFVYEDIYTWYPKVRAGGILMGHDYSMKSVQKPVDSWAKKFGKELITSDNYSDVWAVEI